MLRSRRNRPPEFRSDPWSGELPSDFDILRPFSSRIRPWMKIFLNGIRWAISSSVSVAVFTRVRAGHNHPRHPEENNIKSGHQGGRRVPVIQLLLLLRAGLRPAEVCHRPEIGRSPGVQYILLLLPILGIGRPVHRHVHVLGVVEVQLTERNALLVPNRDAVAPPQLAADTPVLDAIQPVQVGLFQQSRWNWIIPCSTARLASSTLGYLRNHCSERRGSIGTSPRSEKPTVFS